MNIKEVASAVLVANGIGVSGKDIFVFHAPERVKSSIVVIDSLDGTERSEYLPGYLKSDFKVIVRRSDYQSAMTVAKQVMSALDFHRQTVNGIYVIRMRPAFEPLAYPIPDSDVIEVSVDMNAIYVEP